MLDFQPVTLEMKAIVDRYTFQFGENSCQHSFVSSFCLFPKYGDNFCERDGVLYTLRSKKCTEHERVYLFPHCESEKIPRALQNIFDDAREHNSAVKFETVTERAKDIITKLFPEKFSVEYNRDYSEYIYDVKKQLDISGGKMASRREKINRFKRNYGSISEIHKITPQDIPGLLEYQSRWLYERITQENDNDFISQLTNENNGIKIALENFFSLGMSGIIITINGKIRGYNYGMKLSDYCRDSMVQKGDRDIRDIYTVLSREYLCMCCNDSKIINLEEDVGRVGLREAKINYKPEFMIEKYILREVVK